MRLITLISFVFFLYFSSQQSCSIQNCAQCNSDNVSCTQCKEGYTLLNGECPCNDRNCLICSSSFYGGCTQCKANFFLDKSTGTCQSKIEHCLYYTDNGCDFCEYGYKKANGKCEKNEEATCYDQNCNICTNSLEGECYQCEAGYDNEKGKCVNTGHCEIMINNNCIICSRGFISYGSKCIAKCLGAECEEDGECNNECLTCNNYLLKEKLGCKPDNFCNDKHCEMCITEEEEKCDRCEIGYYLNQGKCFKCNIENCLKCDFGINGNTCNSCMNGYYLIEGKCYSKDTASTNCQSNCAQCLHNESNEEFCLSCKDNYKAFDGKCVSCSICNCLYCISDEICNQCEDNYSLINGQCIHSEVSNCVSYNTEDNSKCVQCEPYFNLDSSENKCLLSSMSSQCSKYDCLLCGSEDCNLSCGDKEYLDITTNQCQSCEDEHCRMCLSAGCLICDSDYTLYENKCQLINRNPEKIDHCSLYDLLGNCVSCESSCSLQLDGTCSCTPRSLIIIVVSLMFLLLIATLASVCLYKKRRESMLMNRQLEMQRIRIESENNAIEGAKLKKEVVDEIEQKDALIEKCHKCKNERGYLKLNPCGCILCDTCSKEIFGDDETLIDYAIVKEQKQRRIKITMSNPTNEETVSIKNQAITNTDTKENQTEQIQKEEEKSKEEPIKEGDIKIEPKIEEKEKKEYFCPIDKQHITKAIRISYKCEICFEITSRLFHFNCGCALGTCAKCFNKIVDTKKCPGCRKEIISIPEQPKIEVS